MRLSDIPNLDGTIARFWAKVETSIAQSLDVCPAVIWRIAIGRTWRHVS